MRRFSRFWLGAVILPTALVFAACGDDDDNPGVDAGVDAEIPTDSAVPDAGDAGPSTAAIFGTVVDIDGEAWPGVEACWDGGGYQTCSTSTGMGTFTLQDLPVPVVGRIDFTHPDLIDVVAIQPTPTGQIIERGYTMYDASQFARVYTSGDATFTDGLGTLVVSAVQEVVRLGEERIDPVTGATFSISPDLGDGPHYVSGDPANGIDPGLSSTGGSGAAIVLNVPVGSVDVSIDYNGQNCRIERYSDVEGPQTVPIESNRITSFTFWCDEQ